jgi:hypothetical protein
MHMWTKADIQECKVDFIASLITSVFISPKGNTRFEDIYALDAPSSSNTGIVPLNRLGIAPSNTNPI